MKPEYFKVLGLISSNLGRMASTGRHFSTHSIVFAESNKNQNPFEQKSRVVATDDGRVLICWHPEVPFPYEMTKPLPIEAMPTDGVLKIQALRPVKELYRQKHDRMLVKELMALTHTPKYCWYPLQRRSRMKEQNPRKEKRDREFL